MSDIEKEKRPPEFRRQEVPLDPENDLDFSPAQQEIIESGEPLEFGPGLLYYGRDGLDEILTGGQLQGEIPLTRVAHQWATGGFRREAKSPAIFVLETKTFNSALEQDRAILSMHGADCYPKISDGLALEDVFEVWIDEDSSERYEKMQTEAKSDLEKALAIKYKELKEAGRIKVITGLRHSTLPKADYPSFEKVMDVVGKYMLQRNLFKQIPLFRKRK